MSERPTSTSTTNCARDLCEPAVSTNTVASQRGARSEKLEAFFKAANDVNRKFDEFFRNYEKDLQTMQRLRDQREEEAPGCTANDPAFEMWLGNLPPKNKQPNK